MNYLFLATKELAGKETKASFGLTITFSLAGVAAAIKAVTGHIKLKKQGVELVRLRERCKILEEQHPLMNRALPPAKV
ncbi:MAG TPA: hypothetical protein VIL86_18090 [Tepidisphaeraceae bacterium]